ncbi:MAG: cytochrome c family protein [Desulfobulbaceae bacterium]|nr:cytochrome c family protein [Desulfobulbaceae bacterium]
MVKKSLSLCLIVLAAVFIVSGLSFASDKGDAEYVLKSTVDPASKTKLAFFPHAKHQAKFDCATCHHGKDADGKQVAYTDGMKIEKCESCHNKAAGMPKGLETFKKAAHKRCKTCHQSMKKEGKATGPTKCNGCHRKDLK